MSALQRLRPPSRTEVVSGLRNFGVAALGAAGFSALGLPLPFLLGPMFACLVAALCGASMCASNFVTSSVRTVLGVAVGASITPELLARLGEFALSVALVPVFILLIGLVGYPYFRRVCGFDPATAYYSAMPGGLQDMILFGQEAGANARALSLVHATRVMAIVFILPFVLTTVWGLALDNLPGRPVTQLPLHEMALMVGCAIAGWWLAERLRLFGASIIGPMIVTAAVSLSGLIHSRPPAEAIWAAQFFLGMGVGVLYVGVTLTELRRVIAAGLGYCVLLTILSFLFAEIAYQLIGAPHVEALLAFSPGGQAEMVVLAIVAGVDMAYVVTVHLSRLLIVILGAPIVARLMRAENRGRDRAQNEDAAPD